MLHLTSITRGDGYSASETLELARDIATGTLGEIPEMGVDGAPKWMSTDDIFIDRERDLIVAALRAFA